MIRPVLVAWEGGCFRLWARTSSDQELLELLLVSRMSMPSNPAGGATWLIGGRSDRVEMSRRGRASVSVFPGGR